MKTSVELDDDKVALAKKLSHSSTLKELLDKALDAKLFWDLNFSKSQINIGD